MDQQIETFQMYLEQYRYEENEYIYSMFIERSFKYVELQFKDSLTNKPIQNFPVFSGLCVNKKNAAICLFDIQTVFNALFPTKENKEQFEYLLNNQNVKCPCCQEDLSFNYLVYDPFLQKFHDFISSLKLEYIVLQFINSYQLFQILYNRKDVVPILKFERVIKTNNIVYSLKFPEQSKSFTGQINLQQKPTLLSIDQFSRIQNELDKEINELKDKKQEKGQESTQSNIDEEIKLKQLVQNIIIEEHHRQPNEPSSYLTEQQPFRILKVGGIDGTSYRSLNNTNIYSFVDNKLYIGQPSNEFDRRFQVFELMKLSNQNKTPSQVSFNINEEEFVSCKTLLVYDQIILIVTDRKIYQIQLINVNKQKNSNILLVEDLYTFEVKGYEDCVLSQILFNKDDLFMLQYSQQRQQIFVRMIEDIFVYPEEKIIEQPQVYLELSEISNNFKVMMLSDDFKGNIIIFTPDQYFIYNKNGNQWKEHDFQLTEVKKKYFKPKFNYYDYKQDIEYNNQYDSDSDDEEQKNIESDDDDELSQEEMLEKIFDDTNNILSINNKEYAFNICNIKGGYIYKLNLKKAEIKKVECVINQNIISQNCVYKKKAVFYTIQVQNQKQNSSQMSEDEQKQAEQMEQLGDQLNEYFHNIQQQLKKTQNVSSELTPHQQNAVYCKNYTVFSTQTFM